MQVHPESQRDNLRSPGKNRPRRGSSHRPRNILIIVCVITALATVATVIGVVTVFVGEKKEDVLPHLDFSTTRVSQKTDPTLQPSTTGSCPDNTNTSLMFHAFVNLTTFTSEISERSQIFGLNSLVLDQTYLLITTHDKLYVFLVNSDWTLNTIQTISPRGFYDINGHGLRVEYFELGGDHYFITNSHDGRSYYGSDVYKWDGTKLTGSDVIEFRFPPYRGQVNAGWSFIASEPHGYAYLANAIFNLDHASKYEHTVIYNFKGNSFKYFGDIDTEENTFEVTFFHTDNNEMYLCLGSWSGPDIPISYVYSFDQNTSTFVQHQNLSVTGVTSDMLIFDIAGETYLMHVMFLSSIPLYIWNNESSTFQIHQYFVADKAKAACHAEYCDQHFLVIVSEEFGSVVYKWNHDMFVQSQVLDNDADTPIHACHVFRANGVPILVVDKIMYMLK